MVSQNMRLWPLPFVGFIPILLVGAVFIGAAANGEVNLEEWKLSFLALGGMGLFITFLLGSIIALLVVRERHAISNLVKKSHWARWPQYDKESDWRAFAEREVTEARKNYGLPWSSLIVVVVMFSIVTGVTLSLLNSSKDTTTSAFALLVPIGTLFVLILISILSQPVSQRWQGQSLYRRRMSQPVPSVYIGKEGLYHEDEGYTAFRSLNEYLTDVEYMPQHRALFFQIKRRSRNISTTGSVRVHVPIGAEAEAQDIENRLKAEVIR